MWIMFLEAGVALLLLVLIVWWTIPRKRDEWRRDDKTNDKDKS
jgi:hypothetical protein